VFLGVEFDNPVKLGLIQRTVVGAGLSWVKKVNTGFHYSLADDFDAANVPTKNYEKPHVAFPLQFAVDRFVASKPGEELPELGGDIHEDPQHVKDRKKGVEGTFDGWDTETTYTLCMWSSYVDWVKWRVVNLPGVRPFSMASMSGNQALNFIVYEMEVEGEVVTEKVRMGRLGWSFCATRSAFQTVLSARLDGDVVWLVLPPVCLLFSLSSPFVPPLSTQCVPPLFTPLSPFLHTVFVILLLTLPSQSPHIQKNLKIFAHFEMTNEGITEGGLGEKWLQVNGVTENEESEEESESEEETEDLSDGVFIRTGASLR